MLKSDHFGIEIFLVMMQKTISYKLKSDHFGIEIITGEEISRSILVLKSDHFRIEMEPFWIVVSSE